MLTLNDGRSELWQWDTGRKLTVDADCTQVHFSNKFFGRSVDVDVVDGVAEIPDVLLQADKELLVWAFVGTAENGYTKISKVFKVNKRNKPADYVFTPTEQTTLSELIERLDKIEESQDPDAIKNAVDDYLANNPIEIDETDPTVPEWAKQPTKPSYTASEVGALSADTVIPTIPDNVSAFRNDAGYLTEHQDLTGYATERYVQGYAQPKGDYLTAIPDGYAKIEDIPTKPGDIGAQPAGNYLTEVPSGYATEEFVKNKIAEAELGGEEVDLSGYAQKSELPTKVSQLENDKGYLTEHQDISGKLDASALPTAINTALAQAKASGEFDGKDGVDGKDGQDGYTPQKGVDYFDGQPGKDGVDGKDGSPGADGSPGKDGVSATHSWNGTVLTITSASGTSSANLKGAKGDTGETGATGPAGNNGKDGKTPVKGTDYFTDADKAEMAEAAAALVDVPTNVSAFTNDAEYVSNKAGLVNERLPSDIYGWTANKYANTGSGNISSHNDNTCTGYLEIQPDWKKIKTYVCGAGDLAGICFYNADKSFISGVPHGNTNGGMGLFEYDIPGGAKYFCFSTRTSGLTDAYAEIVKQADGVLTRVAALEALYGKASAITYGYAASNILCIGDSLTAGAYYAGEANGLDIANGTAIAQNYPYYLSRMLHCRTTKAATNGYSASDWYNKYINSYVYADFDTFIIWLGANYGCTAMPTDAEISSFIPSSSASAATANQALYLIKIIQTIQAANPSCHIVLGTVFGSKSDKATNNDVVAQIAEKYGCQLVDMSDLSYSEHPELHAGVNNPHFGKAGNIYIASRLAMAINDYITSNPSVGDFGTTTEPMPTLTASEKEEIVAAVVASLPVYSGEVV